MYLLYSLALSVLFVVLLPYFIFQALRHGKYAGSFKQRMGILPLPVSSSEHETIWVHTVSVGEFVAATSLIDRLRSELPGYRVVVSTATLTGQRLAQSHANALGATIYFPFDWKFCVRRSLARVNPSLVIILETELWPNFLRECRRRDVATILANGRISERSFTGYQRVRPFIKRVLGDFRLMIMQSEADADRARRLGARADGVRVCGNLKYDVGVQQQSEASGTEFVDIAREIDEQFALSSSAHLIVAGSTAPGEEEILLAALREVRKHDGIEAVRLLLAPRHPERFDEVARIIAQSEFTLARRSDAQVRPAADVILLDTIGELASVYRFADVVFVGGSLVPRGGHNVIEPAAFARPIIVGPHTENFRQVISDFAHSDALLQVDSSTLTRELIRLLSDPMQARAMGERARNILMASRGATECVMNEVKKVLASR